MNRALAGRLAVSRALLQAPMADANTLALVAAVANALGLRGAGYMALGAHADRGPARPRAWHARYRPPRWHDKPAR